jgi:N-acetyl-anhydromuramyl-L-alanine amidase AmpD
MTSIKDQLFSKLKQRPLPEGQYFKEENLKKTTLCVHHTAGGSADSSIKSWINDPAPVATPFIIDRNGDILQTYHSKYWAFALGLKSANFKEIEKSCIHIELASYGFLRNAAANEYYNSYGGMLLKANVCTLDKSFRGYIHYENYTDQQIESLEILIRYLSGVYNIPMQFAGFEFRPDVFDKDGFNGITTHTNYRLDKTDCYPHPKLVDMLNSLVV